MTRSETGGKSRCARAATEQGDLSYAARLSSGIGHRMPIGRGAAPPEGKVSGSQCELVHLVNLDPFDGCPEIDRFFKLNRNCI